jgi:hypothetical protein
MEQIVEVGGAVLILAAFIASLRGTLSQQSAAYLGLNLAGSAVLTVIALVDAHWGFVLLEGVWALVSAWALLQLGRGRTPTAAH